MRSAIHPIGRMSSSSARGKLAYPSQTGRTAVQIASSPDATRRTAAAISAPAKKPISITPSVWAAAGSRASAAKAAASPGDVASS